MFVFAVYVPKPIELWESIAVLAVVFLVLCGCVSWTKFSVWKSALAMLLGACVVLVPLLNTVWKTDLGDYGDTAREWSGTNYSDTFFAVTSLMEVGWGKMIVFAGMVVGLLCVVAAKAFSTRRRDSQNDADSTSALPKV